MKMSDLTNKQIDALFNAVDADYDALVDRAARLAIEVRRHRAMIARLEAWAEQLCEGAIGSANVGPFIAAELRNRMKGQR